MARPRKCGVIYFPMDCDFFADDKIGYVEGRCGDAAVTGYLWILCNIYKVGLCWRFAKVEQAAFARYRNQPIETVREHLTAWLEAGLFDAGVFDQTGFLTSKGVQRRYLEIVQRRTAITVPKGVLLIPEDEWPEGLAISLLIKEKEKVKVKGNSGFLLVSATETRRNSTETPNKVKIQGKVKAKAKKNAPILTLDALLESNPEITLAQFQIDLLQSWLDYRIELNPKKPPWKTGRGFRTFINQLKNSIAGANANVGWDNLKTAIDHSAASNWTGLFLPSKTFKQERNEQDNKTKELREMKL